MGLSWALSAPAGPYVGPSWALCWPHEPLLSGKGLFMQEIHKSNALMLVLLYPDRSIGPRFPEHVPENMLPIPERSCQNTDSLPPSHMWQKILTLLVKWAWNWILRICTLVYMFLLWHVLQITYTHTVTHTQIAKTLGSISIRYKSDTKVLDRYLIDIDPWVSAIWVHMACEGTYTSVATEIFSSKVDLYKC